MFCIPLPQPLQDNAKKWQEERMPCANDGMSKTWRWRNAHTLLPHSNGDNLIRPGDAMHIFAKHRLRCDLSRAHTHTHTHTHTHQHTHAHTPTHTQTHTHTDIITHLHACDKRRVSLVFGECLYVCVCVCLCGCV